MRRTSFLMAMAVSVGSLGGVAFFPGIQAASASVGSCGYGNSSGNILTCINVSDSGPSASVKVIDSGRVVQVCQHYDGSTGNCSGYAYLAPGQSAGVGTTSIGGGAPRAGTYCAKSWKEQPDGSTVEVANVCVSWGG